MSGSTSQGTNEIDTSSEVVNSGELVKATELSRKARDLAKEGKFEEAIFLFEQALVKEPHSIDTVNRYTTFLITNNYHQEAKKIFQDFLIKYPNTIDILVKYANFLLDLNEVDCALNLFVDILKTDPKNILVLANYAEIAYKAKKYDLTCRLCEIILSKDNKNWLISNIYANSLAIQGYKEKAYNIFSASLLLLADQQFEQPKKTTLRSKYTKLLTDYIETLFLNQKKDEITNVFSICFSHKLFTNSLQSAYGAIRMSFLSSFIKEIRLRDTYESLAKIFLAFWINENPTNSTILINYLDNVFKANKPDRNKFFEIYEIWAEIEPNNVDILNIYANSLTNNKEKKGLELFEQCLKLDPNNFRILSNYANELVRQGQYQYAAELLEQCLKLDPNNVRTLSSYANVLVRQERYQHAAKLFEQCLKLDPNNVRTLSSYANVLARQERYQHAAELLEQCLKLDPNNIRTLNSYANVLARQGQFQSANELFEISLKLDKNNIRTLNNYAKILIQYGRFQEANVLFEQCLKLDSNNFYVLSSYVDALLQQGQYQRSNKLLEQYLKLSPDNVHKLCRKLNSYAHALIQQGQYHRAAELFEQCLRINANDVRAFTLCSYANILAKQGQFQRATELFEQCLKLDPNNVRTLSSYADVSARQGRYQSADELFEKCIKLDPNNIRTLNSYANLLARQGQFQRAVDIQPYYSYARLQYAQQLEAEGELLEALTQLLAIDLATQKTYHANIIRLNLGRLYYRLGQIDLGKQFFEEAIANSDEQDKTILYAARSLLATKPNSQEAINLLLKIQEDSPRYAEAMKAIALNADEETSYVIFGDDEQIDDIEMLYRAMYHQIGNEIAVLRSISYRLLKRMEGEHPLVKEIVNDLEKLQQGIASQRANEKKAIAQVSHSNYKQLIEIVSKTAHDISDEVNNQLAVIESKTRRAMRKLTAENPQYQEFENFLLHLKITQKAINDLKSINEGKTIRRNRFLVHQLFEKWKPANWTSQPRIDGVRIRLDIRNPDSEFNGDEEKIKSILNELVENSLKHNHGNSNLSIRMYSSDLLNPSDISSPTIPGDRKFLYIEFKDNGQGVPNDKKDWIFQPLKTTSPEDKGSGLGLFIARKTIKKMGGQIREVGEAGKGVRFQIYLPYL